jgi:hypothetical protein
VKKCAAKASAKEKGATTKDSAKKGAVKASAKEKGAAKKDWVEKGAKRRRKAR